MAGEKQVLTLEASGMMQMQGEVEDGGDSTPEIVGHGKGNGRHGRLQSLPLDSSRVDGEGDVAERMQQAPSRGEHHRAGIDGYLHW